ncbi:MAG TPA: VCBS repeat-containing protein [Gammaproteobacteria bacterium]|nr:VCBS repeat-containing protein [Gammaproteobacteria bacterium]
MGAKTDVLHHSFARLAILGSLLLGLAGSLGAQHRHADHLVAERIADGMSDGYQIVVVDLNADGRLDLLPVASGLGEIAWYENTGWQRHVIAHELTRPENVAAYDIDGDGIPEIGLVSGFAQSPTRSTGTVTILRHDGDPRGLWQATEIDRVPTSHRVRWADIDGTGNRVLVNAPLLGAGAEPPDLRADNPLVLYRPGIWQRELIATTPGLVHGLYLTDWTGSGRDTIVTAGFAGVFADELRDGRWQRRPVLDGDPAPWPNGGASEFTELFAADERWLATVEPWHGHQVVLYRWRDGAWARAVIDAPIGLGHDLLGVDLDASGSETLVVADRGEETRGVYLYSRTGPGDRDWLKETLDSDMQASSCAAADLDADGAIDLVCIGRATEELTWYRNAAGGTGPGT